MNIFYEESSSFKNGDLIVGSRDGHKTQMESVYFPGCCGIQVLCDATSKEEPTNAADAIAELIAHE